MINGCTEAAITGIDRVDKTCFGVTEYGKLSKKAKDFLKKLRTISAALSP